MFYILSGESNKWKRKQNQIYIYIYKYKYIYIYGKRTHDYGICTRNKSRKNKDQTNGGRKLDKRKQRKIDGKTKIDIIRSQQIREFCDGWKEGEENETNM